jgi:hypothetical protein
MYLGGKALGERLPKVGYRSHASIAVTGSFFTSCEKGGKAAEITSNTKHLMQSCVEWIKGVEIMTGPNRSVYRPSRLFSMISDRFETLGNLLVKTTSSGDYLELYDHMGRVVIRFNCTSGSHRWGYPRMLPASASDSEESLALAQVRAMIDTVGLKPSDSWYLLYFWPDERPVQFSVTKDVTSLWYHASINFFVEMSCVAELFHRGIARPSKMPDFHFGKFPLKDSPEEAWLPVWFKCERVPLLRAEYEPPVSFMTLGEPGLKTRPLTCALASSSYLEMIVRQLVEPSIAADPRCKVGFDEQHILWNLLKPWTRLVKKINDPVFINSDFKSSTDYLSLELLDIMWKGFFDGQKLRQDHPVFVYWELVNRRHLMFAHTSLPLEVEDEIKFPIHSETGSFMGDSFSFVNLTLYNLIIISLADNISYKALKANVFLEPFAHEIYLDKASLGKPGVPAQIVGDDATIMANSTFDKIHSSLVEQTGMHFSPGKDLRSKNLVLLCEDVAWFDQEELTFKFLDTTKLRLLTKMCRRHADHRASILGRGAQVNMFTSWDDSNQGEYSLAMCRSAYRDIFQTFLEEKKFLGKSYPLELPASLSGISYPDRTWDVFQKETQFSLRFIEWMINLRDPGKFLYWYYQISRINSKSKKGIKCTLEPMDLCKWFSGFKNHPYTGSLRVVQEGRTQYLPQEGPRGPIEDAVIYDRNFVLAELRDSKIEIPRSPYTGLPINSLIIKHAKEELGLVRMTDIIDLAERNVAFTNMFDNLESKKETTVTFASYQRNLYKFWSKIRSLETKGAFDGNAGLSPLPLEHRFTSFNELRREVAYRAQNFVLMSDARFSFLRYGPSLRYHYRSV